MTGREHPQPPPDRLAHTCSCTPNTLLPVLPRAALHRSGATQRLLRYWAGQPGGGGGVWVRAGGKGWGGRGGDRRGAGGHCSSVPL